MLKDLGVKKGINLGGWLSQCDYSDDRLNNFIVESDFKQVADWGFDHVRIPVDYNIFQSDDGSFIEKGFALIDNAFNFCDKYGLKAVLDLHKTAGYSFDEMETEEGFFDSEKYQESFYKLWGEFAQRYGDRPDRIVFELLNEVTSEEYLERWKKVAAECISRIRAYAPDTYILYGSYNNNGVEQVQYLDAPYDDKVVYNFHCYDPLKFTHQGAYWTSMIKPDERYSFEELDIDEAYFEKLFSSAIEKAKKHGAELYCGEYGVIDVVTPEDTVKWYKTIHKIFEKYNIAHSAWTYKEMDFGLTDDRFDGVRDELLGYM